MRRKLRIFLLRHRRSARSSRPAAGAGTLGYTATVAVIYHWTKICVGIRLQSTYFSCGLIRRKCCTVLTVQPS